MANSTANPIYTELTSLANQSLLNDTLTNFTTTPTPYQWNFQRLKAMCCAPPRGNSFLRKVMCDSFFFQVFDHSKVDTPEISETSKTLLMVLYSIIIFVSLVGNMMVLITVCGNRNMRSVTNVFILSLSVSDLLLSLIATPINMGNVISTYWKYGAFACKIVPCITTFCVACSSLTLCCIAFERFYAIVYPLKVKFFQASTRLVPLLITVWVTSLVSGIPQVFYFELIKVKDVCDRIVDDICTLPLITSKTMEFFQLWLPFLILFVAPLLVMTILYSIIIVKLWGRRPIGITVKTNDSYRLKQKKRAIKMLVTVMVLFIICWLPIQTFNAVGEKVSSMTPDATLQWKAFLKCLALSSSCYNPVVYAFMNENFRKNFASLLPCKKRRIEPLSVRDVDKRRSIMTKPQKTWIKFGSENATSIPGTRGTNETKC
ncbi:QRFP-like peptide receptor [Saccostrea cucullata]|uniref:QRFP-like peptide receptor n=1 Tax=Saccostrea cuccullata TaxID=36930 RepID=UPI002ED10A4A